MINVQNSNAASKFILDVGTTSAAFGIGASLADSPIRFNGGALFGLTLSIAGKCISFITTKVLNTNHPLASQATKTLSAALNFFGSFAVAWSVLGMAGMAMTLGEIVSLGIGSLIAGICLGTVLNALNLNYDPDRA